MSLILCAPRACEDIFLLQTQKKQSEFEFECEEKARVKACVLKLTLTLAFVPFAGKRSVEIIADLKDIAKKH
jgi:hypothetical protein